MRVFGEKVNDVGMANLLTQQEFAITDGSKLIEMLLDNAYNDPETATCREIMQNASEVDKNFRVHFPTLLEPWLGIIDNGTGLPKDDLILYASGIGASTKDKDDKSVGGFGMGWKVPFTISDQYTIINRYEGLKYTFSAYKDDYGKAQFIEMHEAMPTDEPNGIEVRIPIKEDRFGYIVDKTVEALRYFDPKPETNIPVEWVGPEYQTEGTGWGLNLNDSQSRLIMGNLWYPLKRSQIQKHEYAHRCPYSLMVQAGIDLYFDIGEIKLPMSREDIIYNDYNLQKIWAKLDVAKAELLKDVHRAVGDADTQWEAQRIVSKMSGLVHKLGDNEDFMWNGLNIKSVMPTEVEGIARQFFLDHTRFNLKSLSLSNYSTFEFNVAYKNKPMKFMVVPDGQVRVPSRLKEYYFEKGWQHGLQDNYGRWSGTDVYVLQCEEDADVDEVIEYLEVILGLDVVDFRDVPEYKQTAAKAKARRKKNVVTKLLKLTDTRWRRSRIDAWSDVKELDMDKEGGIYLDVRNRVPSNSKYVHDLSNLKEIIYRLKEGDIIPKDTAVYGCPGSVKNKLKDHPNFVHIDDVIDLAAEIAEDLGSHKVPQWKRRDAVKSFVGYHYDIFRENVGVEGSLFNTFKALGKKEHEVDETYTYYTSVAETLNYAWNHPKKGTLNYDGYHDDSLYEKMFFKKYPLLKEVSHSRISKDAADAINDYILLKETCNV